MVWKVTEFTSSSILCIFCTHCCDISCFIYISVCLLFSTCFRDVTYLPSVISWCYVLALCSVAMLQACFVFCCPSFSGKVGVDTHCRRLAGVGAAPPQPTAGGFVRLRLQVRPAGTGRRLVLPRSQEWQVFPMLWRHLMVFPTLWRHLMVFPAL